MPVGRAQKSWALMRTAIYTGQRVHFEIEGRAMAHQTAEPATLSAKTRQHAATEDSADDPASQRLLINGQECQYKFR